MSSFNYATPGLVLNAYLYGISVAKLQAAGGNIGYLVQQGLDATKPVIDEFLGQSLCRGTRTVRLDGGAGISMLPLPNLPIAEVTSCRILAGFSQVLQQFVAIKHTNSEMLGLAADTGAADLMVVRDEGTIEWTTDNLSVALTQSPVQLQGRFDTSRNKVEATYTHGFEEASVPVEIQNTHAMLATIFVGEISSGFEFQGANKLRIGSVDRAWATKPYASMFDYWMKNLIPSLLKKYRVSTWGA